MIEVELKAHVRDRASVKAAIAAFARPAGKVEKRDAYWHGSDWRQNPGTKGFRIRSEGESNIVTFKTKHSDGGIEINLEREFEISDRAAFVELVLRLGCEAFYTKRKTGLAFKADVGGANPGEATIEIVEVEGIGDFVEIEILLEDEDPARIASAQGALRALLARTGVDEMDIEPRFYSELLGAAGLIAPQWETASSGTEDGNDA